MLNEAAATPASRRKAAGRWVPHRLIMPPKSPSHRASLRVQRAQSDEHDGKGEENGQLDRQLALKTPKNKSTWGPDATGSPWASPELSPMPEEHQDELAQLAAQHDLDTYAQLSGLHKKMDTMINVVNQKGGGGGGGGGTGENAEFKYGEIYFKETRKVVPYLLVPDNQTGDNARNVLRRMVRHFKFCSGKLPKPSIIFTVVADGESSYLQWGKEVYLRDKMCWRWLRLCIGLLYCRSDPTSVGQRGIPARWLQLCIGLLYCRSGPTTAPLIRWIQQTQPCAPSRTSSEELVREEKAVREFGEEILNLFSDVVRGVVNCRGWFFTPVGRKPQHQLIGDTIDRFGDELLSQSELNSVPWIQYASVHKDRDEALEPSLVKKIRDRAIDLAPNEPLNQSDVEPVEYDGKRDAFPSPSSIQKGFVIDGIPTNYSKFMEQLEDKKRADDHGVLLHPHATHFVFYEARNVEREVDKLKSQLRQQGVAEGHLLVNGNENALTTTMEAVARSKPVIAIKSVGGASEAMAYHFEGEAAKAAAAVAAAAEAMAYHSEGEAAKASAGGWIAGACQRAEASFHQLDRASTRPFVNQPRGENIAPGDHGSQYKTRRHPIEILDDRFNPKKFPWKRPSAAEVNEMMVVDLKHKHKHDDMKRNIAQMLTMQGDEHERSLGFRAAEEKSINTALGTIILYSDNYRWIYDWARAFYYLHMFFNVFIVCLICIKAWKFPKDIDEDPTCPICKCTADGAVMSVQEVQIMQLQAELDEANDDLRNEAAEDNPPDWKVILTGALLILPVLNGIILSLIGSISPIDKYYALRWAAEATESETYKYRCRAEKYAYTRASPTWQGLEDESGSIDDDGGGGGGGSATVDDDGDEEAATGCPNDRTHEVMTYNSSRLESDSRVPKLYDKALRQIDDIMFELDGMSDSSLFYREERCRTCKNCCRKILSCGKKVASYNRIESKQNHEQATLRHYKERKKPVEIDSELRASERPVKFTDDCVSRLTPAEYIACRARPKLHEIQQRLQAKSRQKTFFQVMIFVSTSGSVLLGGWSLDIWIAVSTAFVTLFQGLIEFQRLDKAVRALNKAQRELKAALNKWNALTFVQKREAARLNRLVSACEAAIMKESRSEFQPQSKEKDPAAGSASTSKVNQRDQTGRAREGAQRSPSRGDGTKA
eukprot:COSAG05_NODE_450_length_9731_cov_41.140201_2_plen_1168_part_00